MALLCLVLGHDWVTFSAPVTIPHLPEVIRVAKRVCDRCGSTEYLVNHM
jgi:hypothetical protein